MPWTYWKYIDPVSMPPLFRMPKNVLVTVFTKCAVGSEYKTLKITNYYLCSIQMAFECHTIRGFNSFRPLQYQNTVGISKTGTIKTKCFGGRCIPFETGLKMSDFWMVPLVLLPFNGTSKRLKGNQGFCTSNKVCVLTIHAIVYTLTAHNQQNGLDISGLVFTASNYP